MGWYFGWNSKEELVVDLTGQRLMPNRKAHSVVGNVLYAVIDSEQYKCDLILVILIKYDRQSGWGYKVMSEDMGPYYFTCPEKLLKMSSCMKPEAVSWRENCRTYAANEKAGKKFAATLKEGDMFSYMNILVRYEGKISHARGNVVGVDMATGLRHRYQVGKIREPLPNQQPA